MGLKREKAAIVFLHCLVAVSSGYNVRNTEYPTLRVAVLPAESNDPIKDEVILQKPRNSELVVGKGEEIALDSKITLECEASYPIQFIYSGDGMPEYTTNTSQSDTTRETEGQIVTKPRRYFQAHLHLGYGRPLGSYDSGKYTCRSFQDPTRTSHYFLYIFDGKLFIRSEGDTIYFKRTDPYVRIPCSVTHPKAVVSLQKSVNGMIQCPLNESISFEPTSGFKLKTTQGFDPAGVYVCTSGLAGNYQATQYIATAEDGHGHSPAVSTTERPQTRTCRRDVDCYNTEACLNNGQCGSPCPGACGQNTSCRVVNHVASCRCLDENHGDPYLGCSQRSTTPESIQQNPCYPSPCGTNTICENHNGVARCQCQLGFQGDPYYRCYKRNNDPCNPNPCGTHSNCVNRNNYASCSCSQGFIGTPPHCRAECEVDHHCDYNRACQNYRCVNPCNGACSDIPNTQCRVINRRPVCARYQTRCPSGYYGRDCSNIYEKNDPPPRIASSSQLEEEEDNEPVISPCVPFVCGHNSECITRRVTNSLTNETSEVALCQCPPGKTGNADKECFPVEEQVPVKKVTREELRHGLSSEEANSEGSVEQQDGTIATTTLPDITTSEPTTLKTARKCGTNAIAIMSRDGKSTCACGAGWTGLATISCHALALNEDDVGNDLVEPDYCNGNNSTTTCGTNAYCVMKNETETCQCMRTFKGNPDIGCELECDSDSDCPSEYTCYNRSRRCVDPCEPSLQLFFKSCGRDAFCKVEEHKPFCSCPQDLPHGDPHIHCKEKSWMPNHLPSGSQANCDAKESATCGKNAECRMFHDSKTYCVCMPGFYGDPYDPKNGCQQGVQCRNSSHCPPTKECVNGRCLDPCRNHKIQCGDHAGCTTDQNLKPRCVCNIGTIRNPNGECVPVKGALAERMAIFRSYEDFKKK